MRYVSWCVAGLVGRGGGDVDVVAGAIWLATPRSASTEMVTATRSFVAIGLRERSATAALLGSDERLPVMNCLASIRAAATLSVSELTSVTIAAGTEPRATLAVCTRPAWIASAPVVPLAMSLFATRASTNDALSSARLSALDAYMYTPMPATRASTMAAAAINVRRFDTATPLKTIRVCSPGSSAGA